MKLSVTIAISLLHLRPSGPVVDTTSANHSKKSRSRQFENPLFPNLRGISLITSNIHVDLAESFAILTQFTIASGFKIRSKAWQTPWQRQAKDETSFFSTISKYSICAISFLCHLMHNFHK